MDISTIIAPYLKATGGVLTGLRAIQQEFGFLPPTTEKVVAEAFNLSRAEVKGVISFYADFRREPLEGTEVRLCAAEACQAIGARQLTEDVATACETLPPVSLVPVYCLGLCSVAPAAMVGGKLIGRANVEKIKHEILNQSEEVVA